MDKEWFGRISWKKVLFFLFLGVLVNCQSTPHVLQKRQVGSPLAEISSPELPNGGLGWVTVRIPVRDGEQAAASLEVNAHLVGTLSGEEKSQTEETHGRAAKPKYVELLFFESALTPSDEQGVRSRVFQAFLPIPYDRAPGAAQLLVTVKDTSGSVQLEVPFQVVEGKYSSEKLRVDPSRVHPKKKDLPRIAQEVKEVGAVYKNFERKKFWQGPFVLPIRSEVTSEFGTRRLYNGALKGFHSGLDLRAAVGTPIYPAAQGRVALAKDLFFTGNTVILDHGYGVMTLYAHMSELKVKVGDLISPKQLVGLSGKTGRVNGPHLHWQAVIDGVKVNPVGLTQDQVP